MKLYFENSRNERRLIAEPKNHKEAWEEIHKFCKDRKFTIHYIRTWRDNNDEEVYDVGSHTEFFYLCD